MVKNTKKYKTAIILFLITFLVYFLSNEKSFTPWNHYVRLANSFLHGKLYFLDYQPYLEAAYFKNKHFPVSPPMPAILLIPAVLIFGPNFPQPLLSYLFGSLNGSLLYLLLEKLKIKKGIALITSILLVYGTNHWYLASIGSYWYVAHIIALTFMLLALLEFFSKKRLFLVGFFCGCAFWTRLPTLFFPIFFLFYIIFEKNGLKKKLKKIILLFAPILLFLSFHFLYNSLRYGVVYDLGYTLIPNVLNEPWYNKGIFHYSYIPRHLKLMFLGLPNIKKKFPFIFPHLGGISIFITSPAFLVTIISFFTKEKIIIFSWTALILLALPSLMHGSTGISQFGYRFSMDFMPFLLILTAKSFEKLPKWFVYFLVFISIFVNLWGIIYFNKLNLKG